MDRYTTATKHGSRIFTTSQLSMVSSASILVLSTPLRSDDSPTLISTDLFGGPLCSYDTHFSSRRLFLSSRPLRLIKLLHDCIGVEYVLHTSMRAPVAVHDDCAYCRIRGEVTKRPSGRGSSVIHMRLGPYKHDVPQPSAISNGSSRHYASSEELADGAETLRASP